MASIFCRTRLEPVETNQLKGIRSEFMGYTIRTCLHDILAGSPNVNVQNPKVGTGDTDMRYNLSESVPLLVKLALDSRYTSLLPTDTAK